MHVNFGIDVINSIINENPSLWDEEMRKRASDMIVEGTSTRTRLCKRYYMPRGVLGMNAKTMEEYLKYVCNRRLTQINLPEAYPGADNPVPVDVRNHGS